MEKKPCSPQIHYNDLVYVLKLGYTLRLTP